MVNLHAYNLVIPQQTHRFEHLNFKHFKGFVSKINITFWCLIEAFTFELDCVLLELFLCIVGARDCVLLDRCIVYCWSTLLIIVGALYCVSLEHFIENCWSTLLCIVEALNCKLIEAF